MNGVINVSSLELVLLAGATKSATNQCMLGFPKGFLRMSTLHMGLVWTLWLKFCGRLYCVHYLFLTSSSQVL